MSPATAELKAWTTLRATACRAGIVACRTDPVDGPRQFFTIRHGVVRQHADIESLDQYIQAEQPKTLQAA